MNYKYCEKQNFEDYACGRVIYHQTGMTNFPVRLAQEILQRCLSYIDKEKVTLYDPCCGGGYLLTILGYLNRGSITNIYGSDINQQAVKLTKSNLSLLTKEGLNQRSIQLQELYNRFHRSTHIDAISSCKRMMNLLKKNPNNPNIAVFHRDALSKENIATTSFKTDIVITDVPYGDLVSWQGEEGDAINILLDNLIPLLNSHSVVAIISNKKQKINNEYFTRLEKQTIGKRKFEILKRKENEND